jgi:very-short-patch-repair endonuclease
MKKDKYLQIFNYLLEFSKLRSNPVRDIESSDTQYPDKVWFADIPQYEIFDCITFPNYNQDADYWLKITKPKGEPTLPTFSKLSEALLDWIVKESLTDENGTPILRDTVIKNGKTISLADKPEIEAEFQTYLNNKWIDDLELYKKELETYKAKLAEYEKQSKTYKHLFSIYNKAQQFGEEFELVVGVGLLYFQEDVNSPLICRHIITTKVEIDFNEKDFAIRVSPTVESELKFETDSIIDLDNIFDPQNIVEAEKLSQKLILQNEEINPFSSITKQSLLGFSKRFHVDGDYKEDLSKPKVIEQKPTLFYAPALLLRKRNTRSFTALYEKILENISTANDSIDIPSINDIIGYLQSPEDFPNDSENESLGSVSLNNETIYFPKKYNDEQIEIIEKARRNNKVLVQGPPGTGKSHTIANLICHLLANGKKVLVTAYTKRALEVLKNQLPKDFQNLTVNLLSGDSSSIQDLDASVNAINEELSIITNLDSYKKEIEEKEIELSLLKEQKANTKNEWLKVKEKSTRRQSINRIYQGTLSEIAERIEKEVSAFAWFKDEFTDISKIDLLTDIENFNSLTRHYQSIDCSVFNFTIPQKGKLLSLSELKDYRKIANELVQKYSSKDEHNSINCKDYPELKKQLQLLHKLFSEIENNVLPFKAKLTSDYRNNLFIWKDKLSRTANTLTELPDEKLKQFDRSVEIKYPSDKSLIQIKSDAEFLLQLLSEGKKIRGILSIFNNPLAPANVKQRKYFIQGVQVNGSDCDTEQEFKTVLADIKFKQDFEELNTIWELEPHGNSKSYSDKAKFYRQLKEDTEGLISLLSEANNIKSQIESISSVRIQDYLCANVHSLIEETDYNFLLAQEKAFKAKIVEANNHLSIQNIHPIATTIIKTVTNINTEKYEQHLSEIDSLYSEKEKYNNYKKLQDNLQRHLPILVKEILDNTFDFANFRLLENAIHFKHAFAEIQKLLSEDYESTLLQKLSDIEQAEEKLVSKIGSMKAWHYVLSSLNSNPQLRRHLQAWALAQSRIGQGTGKRAAKFRKEAQHQMEKCKDSVPCWIMPLYKVAETINPEQGMYDYVIIDEASQLGADAIFLLYISKNIIIVGDDKQTSPEYVGVNANTMTPHINRHLQGIPFANFYGTEFSFFDHAKMFCNGVTVLREHFRCMPEIIEFSNKYFYAPDGKGLYPLKQYSENRLNPLETVYCESGYIEGAYQNITNRVEAEAIANKIAEIVTDERYFKIEDGIKKPKTIGVIALQGNRQADVIDSMILKKIGEAEYKKRKIVCGNSASFQGDERDIMFLSLITANNHRRQAMTDDNDKRRFNVAVSRAKEQAWLFHSVLPDDLSNHNDLRWKLLDHFLNFKPQPIPQPTPQPRTLGNQPEPFESWFEVDVYNDIVTNNYSVIPQYEVAKGRYRIDLVALLPNGIKIAIECDGDKYHGPEQFTNDLMRQRVLERCGWQFFRVRGGEYYSNRKKALEPLWKLLSANDFHKEDPPINNNHQHNRQEEIIIEVVETVQLETKRQTVVSNKKVVQPDLFRTESQVAMTFTNEAEQPTKMKAATHLLSFPEILVFTSQHNVYKVANRGLTSQSQVISQIEFEEGEKSIYFTGTKNYSGYLIVAFQNGKAGKISMTAFQTEHNRKKLKNAFSDESKLIFIEHIENDIDLVALSSINKVVLFNTSKINPVGSRTTKGVQVMKQKDNSFMTKIKRLNQVKLQDAEYYRKDESLNVVGYYLKLGDEI